MATITPTRRRRSATYPMQLSTRVRRPPRPSPSREERLANARAREVEARRELAQAFTRAERTYALAVRNLEELDAYLNDVRRRLQKVGSLVPTADGADADTRLPIGPSRSEFPAPVSPVLGPSPSRARQKRWRLSMCASRVGCSARGWESSSSTTAPVTIVL
jgi:hypothetical protein